VIVSIPVRDFFMSKMAGLKRYALTPGIDFSNHGGNEAGEVSYITHRNANVNVSIKL
jgi:hypothetical protein